MALLPEELHNYSIYGLPAMADLLTEIEARAEVCNTFVEFLESLDELRENIEQEIVTVMADMERQEMSWLPRAAPEIEVCQSPR